MPELRPELRIAACQILEPRLVEWHAITLDDIQPDGEDVIELTAPPPDPPSGPYR